MSKYCEINIHLEEWLTKDDELLTDPPVSWVFFGREPTQSDTAGFCWNIELLLSLRFSFLFSILCFLFLIVLVLSEC